MSTSHWIPCEIHEEGPTESIKSFFTYQKNGEIYETSFRGRPWKGVSVNANLGLIEKVASRRTQSDLSENHSDFIEQQDQLRLSARHNDARLISWLWDPQPADLETRKAAIESSLNLISFNDALCEL